MTLFKARSFQRDRRAQFRWQQTTKSTDAAVRWDDAVETAIAELRTAPDSYAYARESDDLPGGPYRAKMFGPGRKHTHRIVFRVTAAAAGPVIELVALRHLGQGDLTPLDL